VTDGPVGIAVWDATSAKSFSHQKWHHCHSVSRWARLDGSFGPFCWRSISLAQNRQRFIDQDSRDPTTESAFVLEIRRIPRGDNPAVFDGIVRFFMCTEDAVRQEMKERVTPPQPLHKCHIPLMI
jgi:hypothetical protein